MGSIGKVELYLNILSACDYDLFLLVCDSYFFYVQE